MKIVKYGVTLKRLTRDDLELLRVKRNAVRQLMEYREYIAPEMQLRWFESINNLQNFYYIIVHNDEKIGLINQKDVSHDNNTMNSGLFLFEEKYYESHIPVCASLMLIEIGFYLFRTGPSYIQVMRNNYKAINYNKSLGYELCEGQEETENQQYVLTKEYFERNGAKLRKAAMILSGGDANLYVILEPDDYQTDIGSYYEKVIKELPFNFVLRKEAGKNIFSVDFKDIIP